MKRRTILAKTPKLRDRRAGLSPYARYGKRPYKYPDPRDQPRSK